MADKTSAVAAYVDKVAKLAKTGKTTEHSFRPALHELLQELLPGLTAINEAKRQKCGAPDFILLDKNNLPVMFVETKDLGDADIDGRRVNGNKEQFDRYKAALDTIVFTDFLDFHFYRHNGQYAGEVRIAELDGDKVSAKSEKFDEFVKMMEESASGRPQKIDSSKRLAELMAGKARMLQRVSEAYLTTVAESSDSAKAEPLLQIMLGFRNVLMPDVGPEEFSDIFAQTLTYGMFAARLNDPTPDDFSRLEAAELIPDSNPFLRQLFQYVALNLEDELKWIVDDLADLFRAADVKKIMKDYGKFTGASDPMVHFYEDFLQEYDAGLRKDRGVWYTPIQIVRFMVSAVDWALKSRFNLANGLADSSMTQIEVEVGATKGKKLTQKETQTVHRVQVLDPATGTGTFLAETVRQIRAKFEGNEGLWPDYVTKDLLPRLNGFELLMASYTMAHLKLDFALRESGVTPDGKDRFRVFLTDSLTEWHDVPGVLFLWALADELKCADEVKRDLPVMVVMGNPPYSGISQNNGPWITKLVNDYKVEPGGTQKLKERKNWLNDDYVKFIRLAEHYVEKNGSGIVAYITPHGFLDNPTFRGMRWHLMQTFDEIWTLNLHGNSNKKEVAPDGGKDECVFNIQQGVAISLFVAHQRSTKKQSCKVYYADLWGKRKDKFAALEEATMEKIKWQELSPTEPMLFFVPKNVAGVEEWNAGFGIAELMAKCSTGVATARDGLVVDMLKENLVSRMELFCAPQVSDTDVRTKFWPGRKAGKYQPGDTRGWQLSEARKKIANNDHVEFVKPYSYRPFDTRFIYYSNDMVDWGREGLMRHFGSEGNKALLTCRQIVGNDWSHVFASEHIVDICCVSNKTCECGYVFPLWLCEENMGKMEKHANMDPEIVAKIGEAIGGDASPEVIFDYIYGILHTPRYRIKFKEFLKSDFPRIPYPKNAAQFKAVGEIGHSLIETHLMRDAAPDFSETRARFPKMGNKQVDKVQFVDGKVYINAEQYFDNVPKMAWEMPIGSYRPAEKWLKDRKGRELSGGDIKHYQRLIIALAKTAEAAKKLDAIAAEYWQE